MYGAGNSFSPNALSRPGSGAKLALVAPSDGSAVTRIGPTAVRVHAGLHIWELNAALELIGLALSNLGAISM